MFEKFYKFKPFNEYLIKELCNGDIYYSSPESFNDPLDCAPVITPDVHGNDLKELYHRIISHQFGEEASKQKLQTIYQQLEEHEKPYPHRSYLELYMYEDILEAIKKPFSNYGVLSLTITYNSPLMWSHYADQHRGVCIEYKLVDSVEIRPEIIEYTRPRSISAQDILEWIKLDPENFNKKIKPFYFFSKAEELKYENEWRCLSEISGVNSCPFEISSILFGIRCSYAVMRTIAGLLYPKHPDIKYYCMRPVDGGFDLEPEARDPEEIMRDLPRQSVLLAFPPFP